METVTIQVDGMKCGGCEANVRNALQSQPGVVSAVVDHLAGKATVEFDPAQVTIEALRAAISRSGYPAT